MSQIIKGYHPVHPLLNITLEIVQTRIILLHAHSHVLYYNSVQFHLLRMSCAYKTYGQRGGQTETVED